MSEQHVEPQSREVLERELREAREELELLRFRLHSVELAFYEHELEFAKAKRQLKAPLFRFYAGIYRLVGRPIRPVAVKVYRTGSLARRALEKKWHR